MHIAKQCLLRNGPVYGTCLRQKLPLHRYQTCRATSRWRVGGRQTLQRGGKIGANRRARILGEHVAYALKPAKVLLKVKRSTSAETSAAPAGGWTAHLTHGERGGQDAVRRAGITACNAVANVLWRVHLASRHCRSGWQQTTGWHLSMKRGGICRGRQVMQ